MYYPYIYKFVFEKSQYLAIPNVHEYQMATVTLNIYKWLDPHSNFILQYT